jgi:hypothetical protein
LSTALPTPFPIFLKVVPAKPFLSASVDETHQAFLPIVPDVQDDRLSAVICLKDLPEMKGHVHSSLRRRRQLNFQTSDCGMPTNDG